MVTGSTELRPSSQAFIVAVVVVSLILIPLYRTYDRLTGPDAECRTHTRIRDDGVVLRAMYYTETRPDGSRWQVCRLGAEDKMPEKRIG